MIGLAATAALVGGLSVASVPAEAAAKHKIYLSMSYIGNDWQAEAANMVKAMAAHKSMADKVDLQVQVAGPNAQRQIQQINAMVQAGAEAIVIFPISPTALNQVVKNACDKGVIVVAYDAEISEPCAYNVHIDQDEAGRVTAEWLVKKLDGKGNIVVLTGVPGTSVDTQRTKAAKDVFAKYPGIHIVAESVGMWSQAVSRTELSKILATHSWDEINGLWLQVGCYTANAMQLEAGKKPEQLKPCAGEGANGGRIQMLPISTEVEGATSP
jgi:ribose transport system substrate-binding protein